MHDEYSLLNRSCLLTLKMSDSQEGRTILNADVRDWGHTETDRRRCLGADKGLAFRLSGRAQGDMWVDQLSAGTHWLNVGVRAV